MPVDKLVIENFKGIAEKQEFEIRPITIFCGPNSSGKSSCIHALAALAQTVKLTASQLPIILDDEYAQVHLGRFLDVVHSKSIKDSFTIGVGILKGRPIFRFNDDAKKNSTEVDAEITYKAKKSAQEIYIQSSKYKVNGVTYEYTKVKEEYSVKKEKLKLPFMAIASEKFAFRPKDLYQSKNQPNQEVMEAFFAGESVNANLNTELNRVLYLGPFRQGPLRRYPTRGSQPTEVGASGESAIPMLANEISKSSTKHPNLSKISTWIKDMGLGKKVDIDQVANTDLFDVSLTLEDGAKLSVPDLGYGISQVLPVLVQCSFAPKGATLLFEQPELHLHEGAARKLGAVFAEVSKEKGIHILAETHSPHLFYEIISQVRTGNLAATDVVFYDVVRRDGKSVFNKIYVEEVEPGVFEVEHPWGADLKK